MYRFQRISHYVTQSVETTNSLFWNYKYNTGVCLGIKSNFLEKVAFWVCEENAQCHKEAQRCILEKACARWFISVGLIGQWPNYPSINQKMSSVLTLRFLIPLISSLSSTLCPEVHSHTILSSLCSALSVLLQASPW